MNGPRCEISPCPVRSLGAITPHPVKCLTSSSGGFFVLTLPLMFGHPRILNRTVGLAASAHDSSPLHTPPANHPPLLQNWAPATFCSVLVLFTDKSFLLLRGGCAGEAGIIIWLLERTSSLRINLKGIFEPKR